MLRASAAAGALLTLGGCAALPEGVERSADVTQRAAEIAREVAQLRGLEFKREIKARTRDVEGSRRDRQESVDAASATRVRSVCRTSTWERPGSPRETSGV